MTEATPRPWYVDGRFVRFDTEVNPHHRRGPAICRTDMTHGLSDAGIEDAANAELIVQAVNSYDLMREVCENLVAWAGNNEGGYLDAAVEGALEALGKSV